MTRKISWTGWKKQVGRYVASGTKVPAVEVNEENGKEENEEVYGYDDHHVGDLSTEPSSSCEDLKSDDATSQKEEKPQSCIKANVEEFAVARLSPPTPPRSNPGSTPQLSPPTHSRSNSTSAAGSALTKGAFKHVYKSGPVRRLSARTMSGASDAGAKRPAGSRNSSGEEVTIAATTIHAAFRVHRSRHSSSDDIWSEGVSSITRLGKELPGQTQVSGTNMSQTDPRRDLPIPTPGAEKNSNGEWDTDTRSAADCEASVQLRQEGAIKRERRREYAEVLRRLRYGLEQNNNKGARALQADNKVLDKPGYVLNWLERAQGAAGDNHELQNVSDATKKLPSESLASNTAAIADGTKKKKKPKSKTGTEKENSKSSDKTTKPQNGGKVKKPNMNGDQKSKQREFSEEATVHTPLGGAANRAQVDKGMEESQEARPVSSFGNGTTTITSAKTTASNNKNERRRRDTIRGNTNAAPLTATAATAGVVVAPTEQQQRKLSSPPFAGLKTSIPSAGNPKKLLFKI